MVTAGVYMIVRNHAIFDVSPTAMTIVGVIGGLTALFAATIGLVQTDIKRVLAYSTVSQLGYMMLGCGIGAYTAAIFHLMTHAFFKALLFLSAGSVIHALSGEQDIRKMGGLSAKIPWTYRLFLIGTIAIAGIPPLAGFWSKDEILAHAFTHHHYLLYSLAAIGALLTSFYMFRLIYLTFYGRSRMDHHTEEHVHESPMVMVAPLMALGVLSILGGFVGFPPEQGWLHQFLAPVAGVGGEHDASLGLVLTLMMIATGIALLGWGLAHYFYSVNLSLPDRLAEKFQAAYRILLNKYYVDELYDLVWVEPTKTLGHLLDWFDRNVIDGLVRAVAHLADVVAAASTWMEKYVIYGGLNVIGYGNHLAARQWRQLQSGMVHHYAAIIVAGLFLLAVIIQLIMQL
jgi:NADH-quinone oxidoreductase subunit L